MTNALRESSSSSLGRKALKLPAILLPLPAIWALALVVLAATRTCGVGGTVVFRNNGTLAYWDQISHQHKGSVKSVHDVYFKGPTSLLMEQTYDASYPGRYHSEVVVRNGYRLGDMRFYGFVFRLPPDWEFTPTQPYNIAQFIADFSDVDCGNSIPPGYIPTTMLWLMGNQLQTRVRHGEVCKPQTVEFNSVANVTAGKWHRVVIQANWQRNLSGYFKLWLDGVKVLDRHHIPTTLTDPRPLQFRVGLYAVGWFADGLNMGSQDLRQVWYDEVAVGTLFQDVFPGCTCGGKFGRQAD